MPVADLFEEWMGNINDAPVAHYTRMGNLPYFFPKSKSGWASAWATPIQFLNDRAELTLGLKTLLKQSKKKPLSRLIVINEIEALLEGIGELKTDVFQMSFSGNIDELGQWRGYASNGMGCSVVTNALSVKAVADVAGNVIYKPDKQEAFANKMLLKLRNEKNREMIRQTLATSASFMKHQGFEMEKEFRLIKFPDRESVKFRETGERIAPYVDYLESVEAPLPVKQIIIGPGWQLAGLDDAEFKRHHVVQGIQRLMEARRMQPVEIISSSIPYDPK